MKINDAMKQDSDDDFEDLTNKKSKLNVEKHGQTLIKTLKGSVIKSVIVPPSRHVPQPLIQPDAVQAEAAHVLQAESRSSVIQTQQQGMKQPSFNFDLAEMDDENKTDTDTFSEDEVEPSGQRCKLSYLRLTGVTWKRLQEPAQH